MNAKELMIGDWVRQKFSRLHLRVHSVTPPYILAYGEEGRFHEDSIEPIPITHEILKENGFKKKDVFDGWVHYESFPLIDFVLHEDDEGHYIDLMDARIKYIHQLQQAMRLCGINKEIIVEE